MSGQAQTPGKVYHVFKSHLTNCNFVFKTGKMAHFLSGVYRTDIAKEIEELNEEVALRHPHIYVDPKEVTIDTTYVDPLLEIKRRAIEEYKASLAVAMDGTKQLGGTDRSGELQGIANSTSVMDAMSGSTSFDVPAASVMPQAAPSSARIITPGKTK